MTAVRTPGVEAGLNWEGLVLRSSQFGGQHDSYCALCRQSYKRSELHDGVMGAFSYCTHCLLKVTTAQP